MKTNRFNFRVWHIQGKFWTTHPFLDFSSHNIGEKHPYVELTSDDCIIQQFTGLQDSKGKDIYEGDIIQTNNKYNDIVTVSFSHGCYCIITDEEKEDNILLNTGNNKFEVIGNIFENPELLNISSGSN